MIPTTVFPPRPPQLTPVLSIPFHRSVTTFHRDHYENIFVVVNGSKTFKLLPPTDTWRLGMREAPAARYDASLRLQREGL